MWEDALNTPKGKRDKLWSTQGEKLVGAFISWVLQHGTEKAESNKVFQTFSLLTFWVQHYSSIKLPLKNKSSWPVFTFTSFVLSHKFPSEHVQCAENMGLWRRLGHLSWSTAVSISSCCLCDVADDPLSLCSQLQRVHFTHLCHFLTRSAHWSSFPSGSVQAYLDVSSCLPLINPLWGEERKPCVCVCVCPLKAVLYLPQSPRPSHLCLSNVLLTTVCIWKTICEKSTWLSHGLGDRRLNRYRGHYW